MVKIVFITPDPGVIDRIRQTYEEHSRQYEQRDGDGIKYEFSVVYAPNFKAVPPEAMEGDIIISRGLLAAQLKNALPDTAVVEVPIGSELITGVYQAVQRHGRQPIAVMGAFNLVYSASGIGDALDVDIRAYLQTGNNPEDIGTVLERILADGRRIVLCGPNTYPVALRYPCHPIPVGMSRESIWQALSEAKHGAAMRRREGERAEQFRTVLNYTGEGVVATDSAGRINVFNAVAADILGIPDAVGRSIGDIAPAGKLGAIFRARADCKDSVVPYRGEMLSVNKVGVFLRGDFSGYVVTLQKSSTVQKTEGNIRRQLYAKGHVARYSLEDIVGDGAAIRATIDQARKYARVASNIMIVGDTGTGKEMFAQGIHNHSDRRDAPFVAINCAALSKSLLESELFGYADGAFTGAAKGGKPGIFEIAHTGTIFLDEISEIPLDLQGRLLRVLQERQIMRLGDDRIVPIDVRIISAANKPPRHEVAKGTFRKDLYYRLNVLRLTLPPLRTRGTDVLKLADHFLREYAARFGKENLVLTDAACGKLLRHPWEGNIRELRNVCECLAVLDATGSVSGSDMDAVLDTPGESADAAAREAEYPEATGRATRHHLLSAIQACGGDKSRAAKRLGISRTTLWRRLKKENPEK